MRKLLTLSAIVILSFTACKKDKNKLPEELTGSLSGVVSPIGSGENIVLVNDNATDSRIAILPELSTGRFSATKVKPGNYHIYVSPNDVNYLSTINYPAKVTAGVNTDVGELKFSSDVPSQVFDPLTPFFVSTTKSYSLSQKVKNKPVGYDASATFNGTELEIAGSLTEGNAMNITYNNFKTTIKVNGMAGPGTYAATIDYITNQRKVNFITNWSSTYTGGNASVTIKTIDPVAKTISGTFTGTLIVAPPFERDPALTEGTFNVVYK